MDILEKYLHSVAYKFEKGYPDLKNVKDVKILESLFEELGVPIVLENKEDIFAILNSYQPLKDYGDLTIKGRDTLILTFSEVPSRGETSDTMRLEIFEIIKDLTSKNSEFSNYKRGVGGSSIGHALIDYKGKTYKLIIKGTSSKTQGDTDVKEALVSLFYTSKINEPFNKENYDENLEILTQEASKGIKGESSANSVKVLEYLKAIEGDSRAPNTNFLNQSLSPAISLKETYPKGELIRTGIFDEIRTKAQSLTGLPADKWNPGDLYVYLGGINDISSFDNIEIINDLFVDEWGDDSKPLVSISLKQEKAQGGKAKALLQKYTDVKTDYNLTREEIQYNKDQYVEAINLLRKKLKQLISNNSNINYNLDDGDLPDNLNFLRGKFAALKSIEFLFRQFKDDEVDEALVALVGFGMSLTGVNPTFFKLIGQRSGDESTISKFKRGQNVILNQEDGNYDPIIIEDETNFGGLKLKFTIEKGGKPFSIIINARNNGNTQGTLEIQSIKPI